MARKLSLPADYWSTLTIQSQDLEALQSHLFEVETPLTASELAEVFVPQRIKLENQVRQEQRAAAGKTYIPASNTRAAMNWSSRNSIGKGARSSERGPV